MKPGSEGWFSIWRIYGGFSPAHRNRAEVTLRIYLDESYTECPYVVGGWAAKPDGWDAFSEKWDAALQADPSIAYLRLNDALGLKKEFGNWSEKQRDDKLISLAKIMGMEQFFFGIGCHLHRKDFDALKHTIHRKIYRDPYYFCAATTMMLSVYGETQIVGYDKIDFILDFSKEAERMR